MQCAAYLFVNRRWEDDENHLRRMMEYFAKLNYKTQVELQIVDSIHSHAAFFNL